MAVLGVVDLECEITLWLSCSPSPLSLSLHTYSMHNTNRWWHGVLVSNPWPLLVAAQDRPVLDLQLLAKPPHHFSVILGSVRFWSIKSHRHPVGRCFGNGHIFPNHGSNSAGKHFLKTSQDLVVHPSPGMSAARDDHRDFQSWVVLLHRGNRLRHLPQPIKSKIVRFNGDDHMTTCSDGL